VGIIELDSVDERICEIIFAVNINENQPPVACNTNLTSPQLILDTMPCKHIEMLLDLKDLLLKEPVQINGAKK
jgi:hypothetical protein